MILSFLSYSFRTPIWVRDDPNNAITNTKKLSVSLGLGSSFVFEHGSRKLLNIKKTEPGSSQPFSLSITDKTFNTNYYKML